MSIATPFKKTIAWKFISNACLWHLRGFPPSLRRIPASERRSEESRKLDAQEREVSLLTAKSMCLYPGGNKLLPGKNGKKFTFATNRIENELLLRLQISQTFSLSSVKFLNTLPDIFQNEDFFLFFNPPSTRKRRFRATKNTGFQKLHPKRSFWKCRLILFKWTDENDSNTLRVYAYFFENREKNRCFQRCPDTCGQGIKFCAALRKLKASLRAPE